MQLARGSLGLVCYQADTVRNGGNAGVGLIGSRPAANSGQDGAAGHRWRDWILASR